MGVAPDRVSRVTCSPLSLLTYHYPSQSGAVFPYPSHRNRSGQQWLPAYSYHWRSGAHHHITSSHYTIITVCSRSHQAHPLAWHFLSLFQPLRSGSAPRPRAKHCQHSPGLGAHATTRVVSQMEYKKPAALCSLSLPATLRFSIAKD